MAQIDMWLVRRLSLESLRRDILTRFHGIARERGVLPELEALERGEIRFNPRMRTCLGRAHLRAKVIELNMTLLGNKPEELAKTFLHELAHLVAFVLYQREGADHGPRWQTVMRAMGLPPDRLASGDIAKEAGKLRRTHTEIIRIPCECPGGKSHGFKPHAYRRLRAGALYKCKRCNKILSYENRITNTGAEAPQTKESNVTKAKQTQVQAPAPTPEAAQPAPAPTVESAQPAPVAVVPEESSKERLLREASEAKQMIDGGQLKGAKLKKLKQRYYNLLRRAKDASGKKSSAKKTKAPKVKAPKAPKIPKVDHRQGFLPGFLGMLNTARIEELVAEKIFQHLATKIDQGLGIKVG